MFKHERLLTRGTVLFAITTALTINAARAEDAAKAIKPEDARQYDGQKVAITFEVKSSQDAAHRKTVFLDSEQRFLDEKNLGVAISEQAAVDIKKERNIDAPADYYLHKTISVVGTIVIRDDRLYIDVEQASQIQTVPKLIKPQEARQHAGETVTVIFKVKSSKDAVKRKTVFLDSEEDFMHENNLGIAISEQGAADVRKARNVDAAAEHYLHKTIRVEGMIVIRDERPYIDVEQAAQVQELEVNDSQ